MLKQFIVENIFYVHSEVISIGLKIIIKLHHVNVSPLFRKHSSAAYDDLNGVEKKLNI